MNNKLLFISLTALALILFSGGSVQAASLISKFEGFSPLAYFDVNGYAIGYGNHYNYDKNRLVLKTDKIDQPTAGRWLDITIAEINTFLNSVLKKTINNNQRTALISLIYNIGNQAFSNSTLLKLINSQASKFDQAKEFNKWIYASGKINNVLRDRREKEKKIYLS